MTSNAVWIASTGSHVPDVRDIGQSDQGLPLTGSVRERTARVAVAGAVSAPDLALSAARKALAAAQLPGNCLSLLIYADVWHQGPDGWMPHSYLQRHLDAQDATAFEMKAGCTGALAALDVAAAFLRAAHDPGAHALIVTSDNFGTKLVDRWCMGPFQGAVGDGACAVLLARRPGVARVLATSSTTFADFEEVHRGDEPLFPPSATEGRYLDFGSRAREFERRSASHGRWLDLLIEHTARMRGVVDDVLAEADLARDDIARVLLPSMPLELTRDYAGAIGFPIERTSHDYVSSIGHLGASDQFLALEHDIGAGLLRPGDRVLLTGSSPGVTYRAAVLEIESQSPRPSHDRRA